MWQYMAIEAVACFYASVPCFARPGPAFWPGAEGFSSGVSLRLDGGRRATRGCDYACACKKALSSACGNEVGARRGRRAERACGHGLACEAGARRGRGAKRQWPLLCLRSARSRACSHCGTGVRGLGATKEAVAIPLLANRAPGPALAAASTACKRPLERPIPRQPTHKATRGAGPQAILKPSSTRLRCSLSQLGLQFARACCRVLRIHSAA